MKCGDWPEDCKRPAGHPLSEAAIDVVALRMTSTATVAAGGAEPMQMRKCERGIRNLVLNRSASRVEWSGGVIPMRVHAETNPELA